MNQRLQEYVAEPLVPQARWPVETAIRRPEVSGTLFSRTLGPLFRRLGRLLGRFTPAASMEGIAQDLASAGNPLNLGAREFFGIRILFIILGSGMAFLMVRQGKEMINLLGAVIMLLGGFYFPKYWLRSRIRRRQSTIRRSLPDALDMLSVCADAGLGFDQSLQRISENWRTPLGLEFARVVKEMNLGVGRVLALRNLAARVNVIELSSFVAIIIQSDQLGMSIAETLHGQANQMRIERRYWAQEQARKIPTKMLFPLIFLILPALFVVVLGPAIPRLREVFSAMGQ
jgi:tight adherence protein C